MRLMHVDLQIRRTRKAAARDLDDKALASKALTPNIIQKRNFAFGHLNFLAAQLVIDDSDDPL